MLESPESQSWLSGDISMCIQCHVPLLSKYICYAFGFCVSLQDIESITKVLTDMKKVIATQNAPKAVGPYSQAIEADGTLYVSGQIPVNPADGSVPESIEDQSRQALKNVGAILAEAGMTYDNVVKTTVLLADIADFAAMNAVYAEFFTGDKPARACFQVAALPMGVKIEIEAIAAR